MNLPLEIPRRLLILLVLGAAGCSSSPQPAAIEQWGSMKEVFRQGRTQARVRLSEICKNKSMVAVGALEGLRGEITVLDGEVWIARAPEVEAIVSQRTRTPGESATLLVAASVDAWQEIAITEETSPELDACVQLHARAAGIDVARPFPFVVEGEFADIRFHVIRGSCPIADPDGPEPARVHEDLARGRIVGFFARDSSGDITHHTSDVHAHIILDGDHALSGHLDSIRLRTGNVLLLPSR